MKKITLLAMIFAFFSCAEEKNKMIIDGNIEGLKKGTIFLQRFDGEKFINIDSVVVSGSGKFIFKQTLESPEVFYIYLDLNKEDKNNFGNRVLLFGEPKKISFKSKHELFDINAKIEGSKSQEMLEDYNRSMRKFGARNIDLLEQQLNATKAQNTQKVDSINKLSEKNMLRRYLFTLNYAISHRDSYISPYIVLADTPDANIKYLDSVYKVLSPEVLASKYGKELKKHIEEVRKITENNQK